MWSSISPTTVVSWPIRPWRSQVPRAGTIFIKTAADPSGTRSLGEWNNCANGRTPWGTFLTCEENFNDMFASSDPDFVPTLAMARYGVGLEDDGYGGRCSMTASIFPKTQTEPNLAGYVAEIDPLDPSSTPKKRTALDRFKHENAEMVNRAGRPRGGLSG